MNLDLMPYQWALALLGAFLIGCAKTGVAGLGVLAVALFANILPARQSAGVVLPLLICADLIAVRTYFRDAHWNHLFRLFPWAVLGIVVGFLTVDLIDDKQTARLIGVIITALVLWQIVRSRTRNQAESVPVKIPVLFAPFMGILAGFTTMVANAAGPIMNLYLLAMRMPKVQFMGTAAWYFLILNSFKVPFSWGLGLITVESLIFNAWLAPAAIAGALFGRVLLRLLDQKLFEALALGLALAAGVRLLF